MPYPQFALEPADPRTPPQRNTPAPQDPAEQRDEVADEHRHLAYTDDLQTEVERQQGDDEMTNRFGSMWNNAHEREHNAGSDSDISRDRGDDARDRNLGNNPGRSTQRKLDETQNPRETPGPGTGEEGYPGPEPKQVASPLVALLML